MIERARGGWILVLVACKPEPIVALDSATVDSADSAQMDTADQDSDYFIPVLWQVHEVKFRWQSGAFTDYRLESDGSSMASTLTIRFFTQDYLETGAAHARCDWTTELVVRQENIRDDPSLWLGVDLSPATQGTDCNNFDPEEWEGGDPREHLENTVLWFGIGPMQSLGAVLESLYEASDQDWQEEGEPYAFSLYFGVWSEESWGLWPTETNYAIAYETDSDGAIQYDSDGTAKLVQVEEQMPDGVIRALPYHSQTMDQLPP